MKSEFTLAFNQICSEYRLSREVVLDAIRAALVTAYRRDWNAPSNMNLSADINLDTGVARIFVTKQVVEEVEDPAQQITLEEARKTHPRVRLGETITLEVTPENFGRIAAQTAKQVITQRLREAERESQQARLTRQIGEIIIGTVQSVSSQAVVLHLDRNEEAILPRSEQIPGERYMIHSKVRVYVLKVTRTAGRAPEIIVSRSHPDMLKRLLELEVPEIRNGSVEIKGVVREAGGRAKIAVASRQPGLDPVGACIGPRGVRIQSLTRELNGERIDVIEWTSDQARFVVNALSVPHVFSIVLDDKHPGGRTANLVVLDEHLSLAIGKNGQNARLTAKLTGWRVDIQGLKEALEWALEQAETDPALLGSKGPALIERVKAIIGEHPPYTDEEKQVLKTFIESVREAVNRRERGEDVPRSGQQPREARAAAREAQARARARVPARTYQLSVETLNVSSKTRSHLVRHGLLTVGDVLERLAEGDEALLMLEGFGARVLAEVKDALAAGGFALLKEGEVEAAPAVEVAPAVAKPEPVSEALPPVPEAEVIAAIPEGIAEPEGTPAPTPSTAEEEEVPDLSTLFDKRRFEVPVEIEEEEVEEEEAPARGKKARVKGKGKRKIRPVFYDDEEGKYFVRRPGKADWDDDLVD